MPKILVQVDDETGLVEAARLRVAGIEYFFHQTTDNEGKRIEIIRHQAETPEGHKVSAYELPFDGWGTAVELPDA